MSDMMRYRGKRALVTGLSLEPGHVYKIDPLERKYGREGFWVEITDGESRCTRPYDNADAFLASWFCALCGCSYVSTCFWSTEHLHSFV